MKIKCNIMKPIKGFEKIESDIIKPIAVFNDKDTNLILIYSDGYVKYSDTYMYFMFEHAIDINIDLDKLNNKAYAKSLYNKIIKYNEIYNI